MSIPFDAVFLFDVATSENLEVYQDLIDTASIHQIYSLLKVLTTVDQCPPAYLRQFAKSLNTIKMDFRVQFPKVRATVNIAFIFMFALQLAKHINNESVQSS